jgi:histone deacetylase 1/2
MPVKFWDEAFYTAVYLINRLPTRVIDNATPLEHLLGDKAKPNYDLLKSFGCACWPLLRPYNNRKLNFRSKECVFIGYSSNHKGYKCLDVTTGRVYISRNVIFDEHVYPFSRHFTVSSPDYGSRVSSATDLMTNVNNQPVSIFAPAGAPAADAHHGDDADHQPSGTTASADSDSDADSGSASIMGRHHHPHLRPRVSRTPWPSRLHLLLHTRCAPVCALASLCQSDELTAR